MANRVVPTRKRVCRLACESDRTNTIRDNTAAHYEFTDVITSITLTTFYCVFRRYAPYCISHYAIVVCLCVCVSVYVCVCRVCGPQENGLR